MVPSCTIVPIYARRPRRAAPRPPGPADDTVHGEVGGRERQPTGEALRPPAGAGAGLQHCPRPWLAAASACS
eukprot:3281719-Alexandrium_andersonii.AAC.1